MIRELGFLRLLRLTLNAYCPDTFGLRQKISRLFGFPMSYQVRVARTHTHTHTCTHARTHI
jgi:hypothetical protein